jgi:hypothetical protein
MRSLQFSHSSLKPVSFIEMEEYDISALNIILELLNFLL